MAGRRHGLDHGRRHRLLHVVVQDVAQLARQHVVDLDGAVVAAGRDVLVVRVEAHAEGLERGVAQVVLVRHLAVRVLRVFEATP